MVPHGRETTATFLAHKKEIVRKVGLALFQEAGTTEEDRKGWVKKIFAAYDNDSELDSWCKKPAGPIKTRTIRGLTVQVGGSASFKPEDYWRAQQKSSAWMWENAGAEVQEFIKAWHPKARLRAHKLKWKSYVLQEAEATSREAKIRWARAQGIPVLSLQHDCVVLGRRGEDAADEATGHMLAKGLSEAATAATGYPTTVDAEWCEELEAVTWAD